MGSGNAFDIAKLLGVKFVLNILKIPVCYKALPYLSKAIRSGLSLSTLGASFWVYKLQCFFHCLGTMGTTPSLYEQFKISVTGKLNS